MPECALPYDVILFDLDGTLTESEPGIVGCVQYALDKMGIVGFTRAQLRAFVGPPLLYTFQTVIGLSEEDAYRAIDLYKERYSTVGYLECCVYPGIPGLLRALKARGAYLAVATAKPQIFAERVLEAFDLRKYFDAVAGPRDEDESRFKDRLLKRALPEKYAHACMVGDRYLDMLAAKSVGVDAIGALYGYGTREELDESGATLICEDVKTLCVALGAGAPLRGQFITLEGSDGCGKSTQHTLLCDYLRKCGHAVVATREPGGCAVSERIRSVVLDAKTEDMGDLCEAYLFAAARAQHVREVIMPALACGKTVVCDRFVDSSVAYQGAGRGLGTELVRHLNEPAVGTCMPDRTILLDLDPELAHRRRLSDTPPDRIEKEHSEFVRRVYEAYRLMAARAPERFCVVDARGSEEAVFERVRQAAIRERAV